MDQIPAAMDRHLDVIQCRKGKSYYFVWNTLRITKIFFKIQAEISVITYHWFVIDNNGVVKLKCDFKIGNSICCLQRDPTWFLFHQVVGTVSPCKIDRNKNIHSDMWIERWRIKNSEWWGCIDLISLTLDHKLSQNFITDIFRL